MGESEMAVRVARGRWHSAEDRLFGSLIADPTSYQRGVGAVRAVVAELRTRADDAEGLVAAGQHAEEIVAAACPDGVGLPAELVVGAASAMLDRELTAEREQRRRAEVMDAARAAGRAWAVVDGPAEAEELTEGRMVAVHLASGTVVQATVDPWAREEAFAVEVTPGGGPRSFGDRAEWLAELRRVRARVDAS